ncbi:hypothetical protein HPB52_002043 [Rhipicephalus sanguineus]|uniref:Uncharacterized protein n=1 Tax=Rhipicephalus sanguineus TaxID=34632 RepID=A0A9D4SRF1_RHISA|nr:hypothetical protein HPB52_002043 [Rhipicephalus sanguineus]
MYYQTQNTAAESIEKLIARGMDAIWALSLTMKGRWTKLRAGQPVDFLSECEHQPSAESFGSYTEVCENPSFSNVTYYKSGVRGTLFYNKNDGRIFSFDNNTDIVQKICRLRAQHLTFAYGFVAYDVDYEDYSYVCPLRNLHDGRLSRGSYFGNGHGIEHTAKRQRGATIIERLIEVLLSDAGPRAATMVIGVMIALAMIVMVVTVITLASTSRSNDKTTWNDAEPDITEENVRGGSGLTVIVPEFRIPKDTWAGLICTIGTKLSAPEILPDDRLCNYLYYDSVYKKGPTPFDPGHLDPALSIFLGHLSRFNYTATGIGFAFK